VVLTRRAPCLFEQQVRVLVASVGTTQFVSRDIASCLHRAGFESLRKQCMRIQDLGIGIQGKRKEGKEMSFLNYSFFNPYSFQYAASHFYEC
jgi:hypothetical protein